MALSLPTFPTWLWRNPNHEPTLDSNPSPIPNPNSNLNPNPSPNPNTNPNPNPNSNPNLTLTPSTHLSFSSSPESQYAILDGESNYQFQWINPSPSPNYSNHHQAGEGNLYAAQNQNYREYHGNRTQRKVITYRRQQRRRRANRPQLIPSLDLDLDFDLVVVPSPPSDHNWSGSESEGSDWSVGWFEPHGPEFCANEDNSNDGDAPENSFAVLVPCYGARARAHAHAHAPTPPPPPNLATHLDPGSTKSQLWAAVLSNVANDPHSGTNHYLQQWLSSLQS